VTAQNERVALAGQLAGTERCRFTELLVDQCGCPRHRGGQTPAEEAACERDAFPTRPGRWFTAEFHGSCTRCDEPIEPSMRIRADGDDGWECCDA
jgi:hypothetical protein